MTTYAYTIVLNDCEMITLENALNHYRMICEDGLNGVKWAYYRAELNHIKDILSRSNDDVVLMSTNSMYAERSRKTKKLIEEHRKARKAQIEKEKEENKDKNNEK